MHVAVANGVNAVAMVKSNATVNSWQKICLAYAHIHTYTHRSELVEPAAAPPSTPSSAYHCL